jgi:hypothetical protein
MKVYDFRAGQTFRIECTDDDLYVRVKDPIHNLNGYVSLTHGWFFSFAEGCISKGEVIGIPTRVKEVK